MTATLKNFYRLVTPPPGGLNAQGICLSKAQLYGTLDPANGEVKCGATEKILRTFPDVENNSTVGAVFEFDAQGDAATNLRFRTAIHTGTSVPGSYADLVLPGNSAQPRGWWDYSRLLVDGGSFDVTPGSGGPDYKEIICCKEDGPEELRYIPQGIDEFGITNQGLFGVDLKYRCTITCGDAAPGLLYVYVLALNTTPPQQDAAPPYFGAAQISAWENRDQLGVLPIQWSNPHPPPADANLNIVELTETGVLSVPAGTTDKKLDVRIANGGAATMPFLLLLSKINLNINP